MTLDLTTAFDGLEDIDATAPVFQPVVGRVLHIDADFLAYMCSAQSKNPADQKSFDEMKDNAKTIVDNMLGAARAETPFMHLTDSMSTKGGRYGIAIQRQYQGTRDDKPKPLYLGEMRKWLASYYPGKMYAEYEADDGMGAAQWASREKPDLSVICSKDKDLLMIPGLHMDWDTGELWTADDIGKVWLECTERENADGKVTKTNKMRGYGFAFFASQMLTGDTADAIVGLPRLAPALANKYVPKAKGEHVNPCPIGPVTAIKLLEGCNSIRDYWDVLKECYSGWGDRFVNYINGEAVNWRIAIQAEARLLWIRRFNPMDENDFFTYMKEAHK